jgi:hypothetical protein
MRRRPPGREAGKNGVTVINILSLFLFGLAVGVLWSSR